MTNLWLAAAGFTGALVVAAALTPIAARLAVRFRVVDNPGRAKSHAHPTPYLGGIAIFSAIVVAGMSTGAWRELGAILAGGLLLAVIGLADDVESQHPWLRISIQSLAAVIAIVAGIRAQATGIAILDYAITFLWIVGITNAFNLLDNMNGLSAGTAFIGALGVTALALADQQRLVGALAATVAGGALGFLPYNFPRARIFMGDAGSLMLGFLLAVLSLKLRFPITPPSSFGVPVVLLGLAVLDTSVAVTGRLMDGRPIMSGATDHLSHRLVRLGMSRPLAVITLLATAAALAVVAFLVGDGLVSPVLLVIVGGSVAVGGFSLLRVPVSEPLPQAAVLPLHKKNTVENLHLRIDLETADLHAPEA